jgi:hypothetical protein
MQQQLEQNVSFHQELLISIFNKSKTMQESQIIRITLEHPIIVLTGKPNTKANLISVNQFFVIA